MKHSYISALASLLMLVSCGNGSSDNAQQVQTAPEKRTMKVSSTNNEIPFSYPAQIRGKRDISIIPQVSGTLEQVCVSEGENVKKGQKLFVINATSYQAQVENAQASVNVAKANVETHQLELNATKQLFEKGVVAEHQYKLHENSLKVAQSQLEEAEAVLKHARNDLSHTIICAPNNGVVGTINYRQGSLVGPSISEPLTIVSDNSTVYAYISLNADEYMELVHEMGSREELIKNMPKAELILGNGMVYEEKGTTETMSGIINDVTGSISVRIAFPNEQGLLAAGGSGTIRLNIEYEGIVIPRSASYELQDKHFVYKVTRLPDGTARANSCEVNVFRLDDSQYIVYEGLQEGDEIVLEGVTKMTNGMEITPKN